MTEDARAASWIMASILIREDRARRRTSKDAPWRSSFSITIRIHRSERFIDVSRPALIPGGETEIIPRRPVCGTGVSCRRISCLIRIAWT
jgi:hypothetical protein